MAIDYYQDDEDKKKRKGGQGNRGRKPNQSGPPKGDRVKPPSNGGSKSSTSNKSSDGDRDVQGALKAGIALSKSLANASGAKKYRDAGIEALKGTPVKANDKGTSDSMDITTFHNAYGSRNTNNTGEDMGQMDPEKRKKIYGV